MKDLILIKATEYAEEMTGRKEKDFLYWCPDHAVYGETAQDVRDNYGCVSCEVESTDDTGTEFSFHRNTYLEQEIENLQNLVHEIEEELGYV